MSESVTKRPGYNRKEHICSEIAVKDPKMFAFSIGWLVQRTLWESCRALNDHNDSLWQCARRDIITLCQLCQAHSSPFYKSTGELFQLLFTAYEEDGYFITNEASDWHTKVHVPTGLPIYALRICDIPVKFYPTFDCVSDPTFDADFGSDYFPEFIKIKRNLLNLKLEIAKIIPKSNIVDLGVDAAGFAYSFIYGDLAYGKVNAAIKNLRTLKMITDSFDQQAIKDSNKLWDVWDPSMTMGDFLYDEQRRHTLDDLREHLKKLPSDIAINTAKKLKCTRCHHTGYETLDAPSSDAMAEVFSLESKRTLEDDGHKEKRATASANNSDETFDHPTQGSVNPTTEHPRVNNEQTPATGEPAQAKPRVDGNEHSVATPAQTPLTPKAKAVLEILSKLGADDGIPGKDILQKLDALGGQLRTDQSYLTKTIIPSLKSRGVRNKRGCGYYIDKSKIE